MHPRRSLAALTLAIIGLGASVASLYDYLGPVPGFCAETGCATVRASDWATPLGIPLPVLGIGFFSAALVLAFVDAPRLRRGLAIVGAAGALLLIAVQAFLIEAWCKLCLIADPAAIGYAVFVLAGARTIRFSWLRSVAVAPALAGVVGALALWTDAAPPPSLPPESPAFVVRAQQPGTVTVVEVLDFECPFCREMHARVTEAIRRAGVPARVARVMMPLPRHANAMAAALAYCCAEAQGKGEAMAALLFAADPETLTPAGCEQLAVRAGCDLERYRRDLPLAVGRVARESVEARAAGVSSLPTLFIGGEQVVGATRSVDELAVAIKRAAS